MKNFLVLLFLACACSPKAPDPYWLTCLQSSGVKEMVGGDELEIYAYKYKGDTVFLVSSTCEQCADMMAHVYSCDGKTICQFGGIAGLNTCPDFSDLATNRELVWKNDDPGQ